MSPARGNVDTRLRRLREGKWDALVLARAGLARLSRLEEVAEIFSESVMLPAAGQGALGIVARADDVGTRALLAHLDDLASHDEVLAERSLLAGLEAGCRAPVAALARAADRALTLEAAVLSPDGSRVIREPARGTPPDAVGLGTRRRRKPPGAGRRGAHRRSGPMSPRCVLVVRSGARPFGSVAGTDVIEYVSHTIEPVASDPADWSGGFDTVIVTSQTAVERIARDAADAEALRAVLESASLVAVGEATAELLELQGFPPDRVAAGSARSILEGLSESVAGRRVLWPCGEEASLDLSALLRERGARRAPDRPLPQASHGAGARPLGRGPGARAGRVLRDLSGRRRLALRGPEPRGRASGCARLPPSRSATPRSSGSRPRRRDGPRRAGSALSKRGDAPRAACQPARDAAIVCGLR